MPQHKGAIVAQALARTGQRGVAATGTGGLALSQTPDTICVIEAAPHDWLFPRMSAVVHHGGAGTTAAGLRAGKPTVICPFFGDQPFWGQRVAALGVGPQPLPQKRLSAVELGQAINAEDGVGRAVAYIEQQLGLHRAGSQWDA